MFDHKLVAVVAHRVNVWDHEGGEHCGWCNGMAGHHSFVHRVHYCVK
jgi:hypothetical protein